MRNNRVGGVKTPATEINHAKRTQKWVKQMPKRAITGNTTKRTQGLNTNSIRVQFPGIEKLPDGRHRYFVKQGTIIDRLD